MSFKLYIEEQDIISRYFTSRLKYIVENGSHRDKPTKVMLGSLDVTNPVVQQIIDRVGIEHHSTRCVTEDRPLYTFIRVIDMIPYSEEFTHLKYWEKIHRFNHRPGSILQSLNGGKQ